MGADTSPRPRALSGARNGDPDDAARSTPGTATVTFSKLTQDSATQLVRARELARPPKPLDRVAALESVAAHQDLSHALTHLARIVGGTGIPGGDASLPKGGLGLVVGALGRVAAQSPWDASPPRSPVPSAIADAARLIRAAADLWATHQASDGSPRSPEACRLRHPSTLAAAWREWSSLARHAASVADVLRDRAVSLGVEEAKLAGVTAYPREQSNDTDRVLHPVDVSVARPPVRTNGGPAAELSDRLSRLRALAWELSRTGRAPAHVLRHLASIGTVVSRTAASGPAGSDPFACGDRALRQAVARESLRTRAWDSALKALAPIITLHETRSSLQLERLRINELCTALTRGRPDMDRATLGYSLSALAEFYAQVARLNADALLRAHARGDVLIRGRAIPGETIGRRADVLRAKLLDTAAPAPSSCIAQIELRYHAVINPDHRAGRHPIAGPPAA